MPLKNSKKTFSQIINVLTKLIIIYEPGDVMTASEIVSNLEKLQKECSGDGIDHRICIKLLEIAKEELHGSFQNFTSCISEGIDFLLYLAESGDTLNHTKSEQIEKWLARKPAVCRAGKKDFTLSETKTETKTETQSETQSQTEDAVNSEENPAEIDSDQLKLFISDCEARFQRAQELVLELEQDPSDSESVKELFRIFHTVKGECGFLKLTTLGNLAHNTESLLDLLRSGKLSVTKDIVDILLKGLDIAGDLCKKLKDGDFQSYRSVSVAEYKARLSQFSTGKSTPSAAPSPAPVQTAPTAPPPPPDAGGEGGTPSEKNEHEQKSDERAVRKNDADDAVIKVKTGKVNYLVDMIGELLISIGQMQDDTEGLTQVRKIARSLQYAGMQLRTESVHTLFGTARRIIRDTSQKVGKQVQTEFHGEDLEIDRTLIESLEEPLMHLIRNSLDHGIESVEERTNEGKPPEGTIRIAAERRGNNIVISVGDDGRGLDREKIMKKALSKGLVRERDISDMNENAVNNLIFISGFSTNESVNLISGRGVGMDIVKEAVSTAKGHIVTESKPGRGTTFSLFFPLSTAIIDGMLTRTGGNIFIIPIASIIESLKVKEEQIHQVATGVQVLDLRGRMIPIIRIAEIFDMAQNEAGTIATIVENVNGEQFAVMSDEILAKKEVVIKNLGACFKNLKGISSGSVLSGGAIGFVLDVEEIIELGKESLRREDGVA